MPKSDRREQAVQHILRDWPGTPGLRATPEEIGRRWQLTPATCAEVLATLVADRVIIEYPDGTYGPDVLE